MKRKPRAYKQHITARCMEDGCGWAAHFEVFNHHDLTDTGEFVRVNVGTFCEDHADKRVAQLNRRRKKAHR